MSSISDDVPLSGTARMRGAVRLALAHAGFAVVLTAAATAAVGVLMPVSTTAFLASLGLCVVLVGAVALGARAWSITTLRGLLAAFALSEGVFWAFVVQQIGPQLQPGALVVAAITAALFCVCIAVSVHELRMLALQQGMTDAVRRGAIVCAVSPYIDLAKLVAETLRAVRDAALASFELLGLVLRVLQALLSLIGRALSALVEGVFGAVGW